VASGDSGRYTFTRGDSFTERRRAHGHTGDDEATGACSRGPDGQWCASRKTVIQPDGTPAILPGPTPRAFCALDEDIIGRCLTDPAPADPGRPNDLPGIWQRLHDALGEHQTTEVLVRIPYGPSEPLSLGVDALLRKIAASVRTWHARTARVGRGGTLTPPTLELDPLSYEAVAESCRALGRHSAVLLALQPGWMSRPFPMKPGKPRDARLYRHSRLVDETLETARPFEEIMHIGEDFVSLWTDDPAHTTGSTAGNEILQMHWAGRAVLQETPARPVELLGVPCRSAACDKMALRRAEPPQHDGDPEFWSVCGACGDLMSAEDYTEWVKLNAAYHRAHAERPTLAG